MATDSRQMANATLTEEEGPSKGIPKNVSFVQSDSVSKVSLAPNNIGIAHHHSADIEGVPLSEYIESFISQKLSEGNTEVDKVPPMLLDYFKSLNKKSNAFFYVCGYKRNNDGKFEQQIWHIDLLNEKIKRSNPPDKYGASYGGEADTIMRMIGRVGILTEEGKVENKLEHWPIYWQDFTLQDAVDYASFAVRVTSELMKFQIRPKTVGGPIDILVIKPERAMWLQRKELHALADT